jgi:branched-chain amino acid transport system permease protein
MREDEQVADVMGVNTTGYKLLAFAMGALIASVSGAIFAAKLGTIYPHSFKVEVSITALGLLIVGGIGSLPGVVVGAFALVGLPELLREFAEYRMLFYGAALVIMMLVRPQGLLPSVKRSHELQSGERDQDDWVRMASRAEVTNSGPSR